MDVDERQHLEEMRKLILRRLHELEKKCATFGINVPPEVTVETEDLQSKIADIEQKLKVPALISDRATLRQLRQNARNAYFEEEWEQAVDLIGKLLSLNPADGESRIMLANAEGKLQLQDDYDAICQLRDRGAWRAVLSALDSLEQKQNGYPDKNRLRQWAEEQRQAELITTFAASITLDGSLQDANALDWTGLSNNRRYDSIEGEWFGRWFGGLSGERIQSGSTTISCEGTQVTIRHQDTGASLYIIGSPGLAVGGTKCRGCTAARDVAESCQDSRLLSRMLADAQALTYLNPARHSRPACPPNRVVQGWRTHSHC